MEKRITHLFFGLTILVFAVSCGQKANKQESSESTEVTEAVESPVITKVQLAEGVEVEVACGECMFGLAGESCDLAVRIDGQAYFVDGTSIDDHGDAHAEDGLCNAIRKGTVKGKIENDRFIAESIELLATNEQEPHGIDGHTH